MTEPRAQAASCDLMRTDAENQIAAAEAKESA